MQLTAQRNANLAMRLRGGTIKPGAACKDASTFSWCALLCSAVDE
ncbi:hypothetical protein [Cupriavidus sp. UME77]|nr:hypothetical protein [Cupriavidus sp. UME77]